MRVDYRHLLPETVFYARSVGPYVVGTREAWRVMGRWLDGHRARALMRRSFGIFRDNPRTTAPELLRWAEAG